VYDVTDQKSFDNVTKWVKEIDTFAGGAVQKLLVGNRCDRVNERTVTMEQGRVCVDLFACIPVWVCEWLCFFV